jgi:hypothetical protein
VTAIEGAMREGSAMRSTASQSIADSRIGVQRGVPLHSATAKEYCPSSSAVARDAVSRSRRTDANDPCAPTSGSQFLAPLIAELRRRIAGDRLAVAEPDSIE